MTEAELKIRYSRELTPRALSLLQEVRTYVTDPNIVEEPFSGLRDQFRIGIINEDELAEIVGNYGRVKFMVDKGFLVP